MKIKTIEANLVDVFNDKIFPARIYFRKKIIKIEKIKKAKNYLIPGLVDAHVHIESSMLIPSEFSKLAVKHGTVAVVNDPHEIANVLGLKGINFMIKNSKKSPLKFYFGASSCVPATKFETSGAKIGPKEIKKLMKKKEIILLSEVMNYPAVINREKEVMEKIKIAKKFHKKIDGHAPGLIGKNLTKYISAGIETDHESYELEEAKEKMRKGMKIIVREGSAAKNLNALWPLINTGEVMLCTDDIHPDDLSKGHINKILSKAVKLGVDPIKAIKSATLNPKRHYDLDVGLLRENDPADMVLVKDLKNFNVLRTWIDGKLIFNGKKVLMKKQIEKPLNVMRAKYKNKRDFKDKQLPFIIKALDGQLITNKINKKVNKIDVNKDILKIVVVNRYKDRKPSIAYIKGFGIKKGAFGSSVMHDSHNICVVGTDDGSITKVVNKIISMKGGLATYDGKKIYSAKLPFAGLMTDSLKIAKKYEKLTEIVKKMGSKFRAPFMTLSFMALLVIPHAKISDKGLFDVDKFRLIKK